MTAQLNDYDVCEALLLDDMRLIRQGMEDMAAKTVRGKPAMDGRGADDPPGFEMETVTEWV